ncbi:MAG: protein kinase, partial [Flavobacteriaceae bacterium]|nr:protein kinase [Flavobacteriaceae bacterium]
VIRSRNQLYIVMEYSPHGDFYQILTNRNRFSETEAKHYFRQLINGLQFIHSKGIYHGDIKLENLLFYDDKILKISDFGCSDYLRNGSFIESTSGSALYTDP